MGGEGRGGGGGGWRLAGPRGKLWLCVRFSLSLRGRSRRIPCIQPPIHATHARKPHPNTPNPRSSSTGSTTRTSGSSLTTRHCWPSGPSTMTTSACCGLLLGARRGERERGGRGDGACVGTRPETSHGPVLARSVGALPRAFSSPTSLQHRTPTLPRYLPSRAATPRGSRPRRAPSVTSPRRASAWRQSRGETWAAAPTVASCGAGGY